MDPLIELGFTGHSSVMTSWRPISHLFLFVLLIDSSKQGCLDYFSVQFPIGNLTAKFPLVKPRNPKDLMPCTLERSKSDHNNFKFILRDCFKENLIQAERCYKEDYGNISYYNLMCMIVMNVITSSTLTPEQRKKVSDKVPICNYDEYETLSNILTLPDYKVLLPGRTATSSSRGKTTTTTTTAATTTTQSEITTTTTTTWSSETTQRNSPTTKTKTPTLLQNNNRTTLSTTAPRLTTAPALLPVVHSPLNGTETSVPPSPGNVLKYLLPSVSLILILSAILYLHMRRRTRARRRRANDEENHFPPLEDVKLPLNGVTHSDGTGGSGSLP